MLKLAIAEKHTRKESACENHPLQTQPNTNHMNLSLPAVHRKAYLLMMFCFLSVVAVHAQGNRISVQADQPGPIISKHIYGHFAEHLGRCIYGGFYVGESNSKIPNINGIRKDVVDALKKLKIPNLRWPGGCFADTYHWKDGIGPKDKRPTIVNQWWGGVTEDNSFGTHDFLNMCELLGTEPYLAGNVGSGTVQEFTEWLQYTNFNGVSPMSKLRLQNGREKAWQVSFWGVGNEAWGCGGNMRPEHYANIYRQYATFMTDWTNSNKMFRIASGANSSDYNWTEVLMRDIPHHMLEGVALHHYSVIDWNNKGSATDFTEEQYFKTMKSALYMEELVTRHSTIMDKYDPSKKIALVVDEWGGWYNVEPDTNPGFLFQQNTMRDAILAGSTLNIFNNHAERVRMANLAQAINVLQSVILTNDEKIILTPTYHVMEMYNVHQDATLLPLKVACEEYVFQNQKLPSVSASASVDKFGVTHLSLVNIHPNKSMDLNIDIYGGKFKTVSGRILTSSSTKDHNTFENSEKVKPTNFNTAKVDGNNLTVKLPPLCVVVLELK
jgi:alpha-N-arabinofuranosidase